MGNFYIGFTGDTTEDDLLVAIGEIQLGDDHEFFQSVVTYWTVEDYAASWTTALRRLVAGTASTCLITSVTDPATTNFVITWPMYRVGYDVYVQNRYLFLEDLDDEFNPDAPWESVEPRSTIDEDGQKISEWSLHLTDIQEFLDGKSRA
jgi:hypothetical protein